MSSPQLIRHRKLPLCRLPRRSTFRYRRLPHRPLSRCLSLLLLSRCLSLLLPRRWHRFPCQFRYPCPESSVRNCRSGPVSGAVAAAVTTAAAVVAVPSAVAAVTVALAVAGVTVVVAEVTAATNFAG